MRFKTLILITFISLFLISGCLQKEYEITPDDKFRVETLYVHSILMVELSSKDTLKKVGLNPNNLKRDPFYSIEKKLSLLEEAYGLNLENKNFKEKLIILETKMAEMMETWDDEEN
mgnify:CR=1 FL=1